MSFFVQDIDLEALRVLNECYERAKEVFVWMHAHILIVFALYHFVVKE